MKAIHIAFIFISAMISCQKESNIHFVPANSKISGNWINTLTIQNFQRFYPAYQGDTFRKL